MGQLATTVEQSQHLLDLGLSADTADMCFDKGVDLVKAHLECDNFITYFTNDEYPEVADRYVPAWSLGALLDLIPEEIKYEDTNCYLELAKDWISYEGVDRYDASYRTRPMAFCEKPLIELAFNTVCWLLENGYIKKEE